MKKILTILLILSFFLTGCDLYQEYEDDLPPPPKFPGSDTIGAPIGQAYSASMQAKGFVDPDGIFDIYQINNFDQKIRIYDTYYIWNRWLPSNRFVEEYEYHLTQEKGLLHLEVVDEDFVSKAGLIYNGCHSHDETCDKLISTGQDDPIIMPSEGECCNGWQVFYFDDESVENMGWRWIESSGETVSANLDLSTYYDAPIQLIAVFSCDLVNNNFNCHSGWPAHYMKVKTVDDLDDNQDACQRLGFDWVPGKCCGDDEKEHYSLLNYKEFCCNSDELEDGECRYLPTITMPEGLSQAERICEENDHGFQEFTPGTTRLTIELEDQANEKTDYCIDEFRLVEYYCGGDNDPDEIIKQSEFWCPLGCENVIEGSRCYTQDMIVTGRLVDAVTELPMQGVEINPAYYYFREKGMNDKILTDENGVFSFVIDNYRGWRVLSVNLDCYAYMGISGEYNSDEELFVFRRNGLGDHYYTLNEDAVLDMGDLMMYPAADLEYTADMEDIRGELETSFTFSHDNGFEFAHEGFGLYDGNYYYDTNFVLMGKNVKPASRIYSYYPVIEEVESEEGEKQIFSRRRRNVDEYEGEVFAVPHLQGCRKISLEFNDYEFTWGTLESRPQLMLEQDFNDFKFDKSGLHFERGCDIVRKRNCVQHHARYKLIIDDELEGKAYSMAEINTNSFTNIDFVNYINSRHALHSSDITELEIGNNNVYLFDYRGEIVYAWYNNDIAFIISTWHDQDADAESSIDALLNAYLDEFPSDLSFEDPRIIIENFGDIHFRGIHEEIEFELQDGLLDAYVGEYSDNVLAFVETYDNDIESENLRQFVEHIGIDYNMDEEDSFFFAQSADDLFAFWTSGNKFIAVGVFDYRGQQGLGAHADSIEDDFLNLLGAYIEYYGTDLMRTEEANTETLSIPGFGLTDIAEDLGDQAQE